MFKARLYAARIYNARMFGGMQGGGPQHSKGRRLVRWIISAPAVDNPVGVWIRQRDDEEILFLG